MDINVSLNKLKVVGSVLREPAFEKIEFDSRKVAAGDMFVAIVGTASDGHDFIETAIGSGAKMIVCEKMPEKLHDDVSYIQVESSSEALGVLASDYYGNPSSKLKLVGVTGTNGKTTIAGTLYNLTRKLGYKVGLFSTVKVIVDTEVIPATHTTPDPLQLNGYLAKMVDCGCDYCFMEVSSHSVVQNRIAGLTFAGGIFTNITHDHLDFHKTFAEYIKAKQGFFTMLPQSAFAITNIDDRNGEIMYQNSKATKYKYSLLSAADFKARIVEDGFAGMQLDINGSEVWVNFIGKFNAYNLLAVYGTAILLGFDKLEVLKAMSELHPVDGRFEIIRSKEGVTAIVDYAHTPDALQNVISTINEIRCGEGTLITVVGCGGNRDKTKRPEMAAIAAEMSDKLILTSDNPRNENPEDILDDMQKGIEPQWKNRTLRISSREEAIRTACMMAKKGDIILVAGKGHEKYQEIKGVRHHFDDKEVLNNAFNN
jgi:UDP-N-acetylmuramoyl-L-alanyl-D-glutamate--2,6-diaminopimelate ligase